jgi:Asp-tRNA(Asn)/Glu-tRNA(Gln) amidotransferase A subunit family amidase
VNGPLCHSPGDLHEIFKAIAGEDAQDSNSVDFSSLNPESYRDRSRVLDDSMIDLSEDNAPNLRGVTIGVVEEFQIEERDPRNKAI